MMTAGRDASAAALLAIEEGLDSVASPAVHREIVASALSAAGLVAYPRDGVALREFALGALHRAVAARLGADAADELSASYAALFARFGIGARSGARAAESGLRAAAARDDRDHDTTGSVTTEPSAELPVLLVAARSLEGRDLDGDGRAVVRAVADVFTLLEALGDHRSARIALLFECESPAFEIESLATAADELPPGSRVLLVEPTSAEHTRLRALVSGRVPVLAVRRRPDRILFRQCLDMLG
jgi:hypothetical protein